MIFPRTSKRSRGFTLIELLVVIAIIGLLSSVVLASLNTARVKARDSVRFSDMKNIQIALEFYYDDNGQYPPYRAYTAGGVCGSNWCNLENALEPYMTTLPRDPNGLQTAFRYYYESNAGDGYTTYGLMMRVEHSGNFARVDEGGFEGYDNVSNGTYYEVGPQPSYCQEKYSGSGGRWWSSGTNACVGGN